MKGIFIGSFNPPTKAHLEIALNLNKDFEKIIFVPVNSREKHLISLDDRYNMLMILKRKYNFLDIDRIMENYSYLNYRIIDLLKKKYHDIKIIIGSDLLEKMDTFDNYDYLLSNYSFIVVTREYFDTKKIINEKFFKYHNHFQILEYFSDISSSKVRKEIKEKKDLEEYLDSDIILYIKNNHLYF